MSSSKSSQAPKPIDLMELWGRFVRIFKRMWLLVLVLGLLGGGLFYVRAKRAFVPMYKAEALFSVSSGYDADDIFASNYYDNAAAKQLAEAFPYMLSTDLMQELMKQDLGKSYINGVITPTALASTNLFSLKVQSNSPDDAYQILWAAINVFPQVAVYMVDYPQVVILDEPEMPRSPYNSFDGRQDAGKGAMLGLCAGVLLVFLAALSTSSVYSAQQLKELVNLPILAVLPSVQNKKRRSGKAQFVMEESNPEIRETVRSLNMKVQKALGQEENKVILVTSTLKGEGKTTIASNLAMSLAKDGFRVALIDGDLRSQGVAQRFALQPGQYGLLDCMSNSRLSVLECLNQVPESSLWILSGASNVKRNYSIDPKGMRRVLDSLREQFDYIVMDTSPCALVAETTLLCHYAGAVLFVVRPDCASRYQIMDTINELYDRGVNVAGMVFNGAQLHHSSYGYGYKYGYGYGYKYGYGYGYGYGYSNKKRRHKK